MEVDDLFAELRPLMGEKLERLRLAYLAEDMDGRREIESMLRIMHAQKTDERIDRKRILLPPPDAETATGEFVVGDVVYNDRRLHPFGIRRGEMIQHTAVFGRSGSGKTNTVFQVIGQLLKANVPFLIFDWKRNYRDLLSLTDKEILVYTVGRPVAPIQFNPLIPPPGVEPQVHLKLIVNIIAKAFFCGDGVISLLQQAIDSVYAEAGVYDGTVTRFPVMQNVLEWLVKYPAKGRAANWMASTLRAVRSMCFGQMGRVINCHRPLVLADLLNRNVVLELDALEGAEKTFFIDAFLLAIHHYRMGQTEREALRHVIILEEAHHVLRAHDGAETVTDVILREIRELNTGIILIDQHPSLLALTALGNTYTTITMNLKTRADLNAAGAYTLLGRDQLNMLGELPVGAAIVKLQDRFVRPFLVQIPRIDIRKGSVTDADISARMGGDSSVSGGVPPTITEPREHRAIPVPDKRNSHNTGTIPNSTELSFLQDVLRHPELGMVQRGKKLALSRRKSHAVKAALVGRELVKPVDVSTGAGRTVLLELTREGRNLLRQQGIDTTGYLAHGGVEHEYHRRRIAEALALAGYRTTREYRISGNGAIDLLAERDGERMAVEVETGASDMIGNIRKCLAADFDRVVFAATCRETLDRIRTQTAENGINDDRLDLVLATRWPDGATFKKSGASPERNTSQGDP